MVGGSVPMGGGVNNGGPRSAGGGGNGLLADAVTGWG